MGAVGPIIGRYGILENPLKVMSSRTALAVRELTRVGLFLAVDGNYDPVRLLHS